MMKSIYIIIDASSYINLSAYEYKLGTLLSVLNQETELYRSMLLLIEKEKNAAIQSELSTLIETGFEKENILLQLRLAEDQRSVLVKKLSEILKHSHRDLTLTMISWLRLL